MSTVEKKDIKGKVIKLNDIIIYGGINGSANKIGVALIGIVIDLLPESDPRVKILVSNTRKPAYKFITRYKCADRLCVLDTAELDKIRNICHIKNDKIIKKTKKDKSTKTDCIGDAFFKVIQMLDNTQKDVSDTVVDGTADPINVLPHILKADPNCMRLLIKDIIEGSIATNSKVNALTVRDALRNLGYYALYADTKMLYDSIIKTNKVDPFLFS